jgi:putative phosphoribosyl transferase
MHFKDRFQAGRFLAAELLDYKDRADVVVLALPSGGVPVGYVVAETLRVPLDVLVVRKIGLPGCRELAMGALATDDIENISSQAVEYFQLSRENLQKIIDVEREELLRREKLFRNGQPFPEVQGKVVILIDDGVATGETMGAAITAVSRHGPQKVIVAVPVGAPDTCWLLTERVNKVVCLYQPVHFHAVGAFYADFHHVTDGEVESLLQKAHEGIAEVSAVH